MGGGGKTRISGYDPMEQSAPLEPAREHRDPVGHLHPVGLRPGGENAARATGLGGGGDRPVVVAVPVALAVAGRRSGPNFASNGCNPPQREIALRAAGLRARGYGQDPGEAVLQPEPRSTLPESNPHDEPATGRLAAGLRSGGEREAAPRRARLSPIKAAAVCSTTLARAWEPSLLSVLAPLFAPAVPPRSFVPQLRCV